MGWAGLGQQQNEAFRPKQLSTLGPFWRLAQPDFKPLNVKCNNARAVD